MAQANEREYVIPLRRECSKVKGYEKAARAVKAIKKFIAKHMKVVDRDLSKVKLDVYLNNEVWFRGRKNFPAKIKVKAKKEGDIVRVDFVEEPEVVKFTKAKHARRHKAPEKPVAPTPAKKPEEKTTEGQEKTEEKKEDEKEKAKSVEAQNVKQAEAAVKAQKHTTKVKEPQIQRKALKK